MTTKKKNHAGSAPGKRNQSHSVSNSHTSGRVAGSKLKQYLLTAGIGVAAFLGAYGISHAVNGTPAAPATAAVSTAAVPSAPVAPRTDAPAEQAATTQNGVQKIAVKVGFDYAPSVIRLKAGVPSEITFGAAQGCTSVVQSADLGFQEDLSSGAKTVKLNALQPGTYGFACGMNMVRGQIVVS